MADVALLVSLQVLVLIKVIVVVVKVVEVEVVEVEVVEFVIDVIVELEVLKTAQTVKPHSWRFR